MSNQFKSAKGTFTKIKTFDTSNRAAFFCSERTGCTWVRESGGFAVYSVEPLLKTEDMFCRATDAKTRGELIKLGLIKPMGGERLTRFPAFAYQTFKQGALTARQLTAPHTENNLSFLDRYSN